MKINLKLLWYKLFSSLDQIISDSSAANRSEVSKYRVSCVSLGPSWLHLLILMSCTIEFYFLTLDRHVSEYNELWQAVRTEIYYWQFCSSMNYWTGLLYFSYTNGGFVGSVRFGTHKFVLGWVGYSCMRLYLIALYHDSFSKRWLVLLSCRRGRL
jgi:hypothetical protein